MQCATQDQPSALGHRPFYSCAGPDWPVDLGVAGRLVGAGLGYRRSAMPHGSLALLWSIERDTLLRIENRSSSSRQVSLGMDENQ
ncbi:hypothetical protein Trydic_g13719 [Trypoxylus dichotomus]